MKKILENKNCIITGASGDIGMSCARIFHSHGANLILIYNKNKKNISLGRLGKLDDVGYVALFLASYYSAYVNGQDLKVDGQIKIF